MYKQTEAQIRDMPLSDLIGVGEALTSTPDRAGRRQSAALRAATSGQPVAVRDPVNVGRRVGPAVRFRQQLRSVLRPVFWLGSMICGIGSAGRALFLRRPGVPKNPKGENQ